MQELTVLLIRPVDANIICNLPEWRLLVTCTAMALASGWMLWRIAGDIRRWWR